MVGSSPAGITGPMPIGVGSRAEIRSPGRSRSSSRMQSRPSRMLSSGSAGSRSSWPAPCVPAYQGLRCMSFLVAVTFAAEIGDVRRFNTQRQLMSFLGLVPAERSTGETVRRCGLSLVGNRRARRVLVEAAWSYRHPARVSETLRFVLKRCQRQSATSPGRPSFGSTLQARGDPSSSPRSPATWLRCCGRSAAR